MPKLISKVARCLPLLALALGGCSDSTPNDDAIEIGLLLPFTGADAATSSNFERAALFAAARVNRAGGIGGKSLRIISQDTHSAPEATRRSAQWLVDSGVRAIVGPESTAMGSELFATLTRQGVVLVSPVIGAVAEPTDCTVPWFRLAPTAKALGEALADQVVEAKHGSIVVITEDDTYNAALGSGVAQRFIARRGQVLLELQVDPNAQSYGSSVRAALNAGAEAIVLSASARTGALLVNEFDALAKRHINWFLSPSLKTELFVANAAPDALEGAIGVAPKIQRSPDFVSAFAREWQGDEPLEGAYFYYDAVGLLTIALAREAESGSKHSLVELAKSVRDSANTPGEAANWDEVDARLPDIAAGERIFYSGVTGPLSLLNCGSREQQESKDYQIVGGRIVTPP